MKKKLIVFSLLLSACVLHAQPPSVSMKTVSRNDTSFMDGIFNHAEIIDFAIMGAVDEFMHDADTVYRSAVPGLDHVSKYFISSPSFTLAFLPELPSYVHKNGSVSYHDLEFQVLQNNIPIETWKPVSSLQKEKDYFISYSTEEIKDREWPSLHAGTYQLPVGDKLLVKIRRMGQTETLQHIYVERIRVTPPVNSIKEFPAGTGIQEILNKEVAGEGRFLLNGTELEIEPGNSVLFSFSRDVYGKSIIEYTFSNDLTGWTPLQTDKDAVPTILPLYLFVDKPDAGKTTDIYIRYRHQPESVKHIKIIVKPKRKQTSWVSISASLVLAFLLFITGYYFNRRKNKKKLRQLSFKKQELESKLQLLSGQLNPHFLFNSLNSIQNLINKEEGEHAARYLSKVSEFLRTVMDAGKKEYISLQEELEIAEEYLQLEQKRRPFRYVINHISGIDLSQIDFPPLLLQPVLENSIHHGFTRNIPDPVLRIEIFSEGNNIMIIVSDNGEGFNPASAERGHGISLVEKRINIMNEKINVNAISMDISSASTGTTTTFTFKNWI